MDFTAKAVCTVVIRKGRKEDIPAILSIIKDVVSDMETSGLSQWDEQYPNEAIVTLDIDAGTLFIYEDAGVPKAVITLNEFQDKEYAQIPWLCPTGANLVIHRLCVDPKHKGRGIATQLVKYAENEAIENGYVSIRLDTFSQNRRSQELYERMGYIRLGSVTFRKGEFYCFEKPLQNV